ncbi:hypothetical protein AN958_08998 [Leucoagaricus sp. SymC.cos]|nr:hypothetical protein AN958_08998 [Leucoagaricus sp. SymC.cos]
MRPLTLHASALNDDEYDFYTNSILDLALCDSTASNVRDYAFYEQISILKYFSSTLAQGDTLSGGQFFAALRLVLHASNGRDVDRSLAFVQARFSGPSSVRKSTSYNDPPQLPRRSGDREHDLHTASKAAQTLKKAEEQLEKERVLQVLRSSAVVSGGNVRQPGLAAALGVGPGDKEKVRGVSTAVGGTTSPVARSESSASAGASASASWSGTEDRSRERERPPLPRRRRAPPRHRPPSPPASTTSLEQIALAVAAPSGTRSMPHTPFNSTTPHTSSPFDSPTSSPSRRPTVDLPPPTSGSLPVPPPPMHPDRKQYGSISHQIASTPSHSHHAHSQQSEAISPFRRNLETFEAIYGTGAAATSPVTRTSSTTRFSAETPTTPTPPTPNSVILESEETPSASPQSQARIYRSKSLHYQSAVGHGSASASGSGSGTTLPPPPPVRKKRPESIQILSSRSAAVGSEGVWKATSSSTSSPSKSTFFESKKISITQSIPSFSSSSQQEQSQHRRSSYSSSYGGSGSASIFPFCGNGSAGGSGSAGIGSGGGGGSAEVIQRKLAELQLSAIPVLEKARYKAEAGLSPRRGFIQGSSSSAHTTASGSSSMNGSSLVRRSSRGGNSVSVNERRREDREGREGLMSGYRAELSDEEEEEGDSGYAGTEDVSVDSGDEDSPGGRRENGKKIAIGRERDELKWPVDLNGEGWTQML